MENELIEIISEEHEICKKTHLKNVINNGFSLVLDKREEGANVDVAGIDDNLGIVAITNKFLNFPKKDQETIIEHDFGHIVFEHLKDSAERTIKKENEADIYAAIQVGKERVVDMLDTLIEQNKKEKEVSKEPDTAFVARDVVYKNRKEVEK